jgi:glycosyltransferase involved in cell wall biosynthesis
MRRLRILYLHQYFNLPSDAGGTRSYETARRLVASGHRVDVVTTRRDEGSQRGWRETEEAGIHVHWIPIPYANAMSYPARVRAFFAFAWAAALRTRSIESDVVFATSTPLTIAVPGVYAARRQRIPMVFEVRDLWPELPIAMGALRGPVAKGAGRALERFAYRNSSRIVALSPGMKAGILRTGYPAHRVHVIPNAADLDLFDVPPGRGRQFRARHPWLGERPLVVYAGAVGKIHGVDYLARVAAAARTAAPEIRFAVVGEGGERERVEALARDLGVLGANFFMLPALPKAEMPAILSAADLATSLCIDLPALWDNSANKFFDALAAGRPIAINYQGWQADLLAETGAGIVLDARNVDAAARDLTRALRDGAWLDGAGRAASRLARERFSRDRLASELEAVLLAATPLPISAAMASPVGR